MEPFISITERAAPFPRANIDTDAIIPVLYMRGSTKNVSDGLFGLWRRDANGTERPDFVLNQPKYKGAKILVAGPNFGCGSSREAAVWALTYSGIRCVIAPSFGEIFFENALRNGLLPALISEAASLELIDYVQSAADPKLTVNLPAAHILAADKPPIPFAIAETRKQALMEGRDEIATSLMFEGELAVFQANDRATRPWIYDRIRRGD